METISMPVQAEAAVAIRRPLTDGAAMRLLREARWGTLAVAERSREAAVPVAVPSSYVESSGRIYVTTGDGRKLRALKRNPHVCLTVSDVRSLERWRSVMVIGRARLLDPGAERSRAIDSFVEAAGEGGEHALRHAEHLNDSQIFAIEVDEVHGYAVGDELLDGYGETVWGFAATDAPAAESEPDGEPRDGSLLASDAMNALRRVVRSLRSADADSEGVLGISAAQLFVLRELEKAGTLTVGELAERTATAQSSVSEVVARLGANGLVERGRDDHDRRRAAISLSDAGRDLLGRAPETVQERLLGGFQRLHPAMQLRLADALSEWVSASGLREVTPTMFFEPLVEA